MAQQSARRGRKNQVYSSCLEHAFMIWSPVCELPYGPRSFIAASSEAGQMAASDYVPNFFKNRLHLAGRPQMSTRPSKMGVRAMPPIRLSDDELDAVFAAARPINPDLRDPFLRAVAHALQQDCAGEIGARVRQNFAPAGSAESARGILGSGNDCILREWQFGKGITFPPPKDLPR